MTTCLICNAEFSPKRKEQFLCSMPCRQMHNSRKQVFRKTGTRQKPYKTRLTEDGYLRMYAAKHPYANGRKEIHVHVMVMEMHIGRAILPGECVHHKNEDKTDNSLQNLLLMTHSNHSYMHALEQMPLKTRGWHGRFARA